MQTAVSELLLRFGSEGGAMEVSMSVCCHAGTHRSVAIAERIAQFVKWEVGRRGGEEGVRVVCRHVHRVKGRADPF
ncbi:RapZ C-terminal domain-containing protein [Nocardioides cremeus]|uniref:RapZ C-terminal domain-containing protein n=1 Tax=Nocardioides cremeus TaxID=3058044 RepID=UPI003F6BB257